MDKRLTVHKDQTPIYDIVLEKSFDRLAEELEKLHISERKICIVTDSVVAGLYLEQVKTIMELSCRKVVSFVFPAGEENKNLDTVRRLYEFLILEHFDRKDMLAALGGGVVGDLCGYAAATYLRGVSFIQIPTTLLSQVDSSIGGKTGVDFASYKNMVGAFHMPKLVYTNISTLLTLPDEQFSSGMGEIIKHGLIKDAGYYQWIIGHRQEIIERDLNVCLEMVMRSDEIKRAVVEKDPTEQGDRALLNLGHTLGHAIEKHMNFRMYHGHCVGLGFLAAAVISRNRGNLSAEDVEQIGRLLDFFHMPVSVKGIDMEEVLAATKNDKKMDGGRIRFILLREIGNAYIDRDVTPDEMREGLKYIFAGE